MALKEIKNKLIDTLKDYQPLFDYVGGNFIEGWRESLVDFPCVVVRLVSRSEADLTYSRQECSVRFIVAGLYKEMDKDGVYDSLFDFENLILKALGTDRRLGGLVEHVEILNTLYESETFPVRNFAIEVNIRYTQNSSVRA
jgi:hypothetical protein